MTLSLHTLKPKASAHRKAKYVGRGNASGHGTYSARGQKGQKARTGSGRGRLKRLGMRPMLLSLPKLGGFKSFVTKQEVVNCSQLEKAFSAGETVTPSALFAKKLISTTRFGAKILSKGELTKKLAIKGCLLSKGALDKIKKAGGKTV
ncbi:MAG: 50S ribosomal protein L15 [Candidatus Magasanikbacteria bacterium]|nr:50S ribosomal protein L15 [Candidatus Magasanikbacteria bacterium]